MTPGDIVGTPGTAPASTPPRPRQLEFDLFSTEMPLPDSAGETLEADTVPPPAPERIERRAAPAIPVPRCATLPDPTPSGDARPPTLWACLQFLATRTDVPRTLRRDAHSAVSTLQRMLDIPTGSKRRWQSAAQPVGETLPAAPQLLRPILAGLQPGAHGITHDRMLRITSAVTSMLRHCGWIGSALLPHKPQASGFDTLWGQARVRLLQQAAPLGPAFRYWHERGLAPDDVRSSHLEDYVRYRTENSLSRDHVIGFSLVSAWNRMIDVAPEWPRTRLQMPSLRKPRKAPDIGDLLPSVQADLGQYLKRLEEPDDRADEDSEPLSASSIKQHRGWLLRGIGCLRAGGMPLEQFDRLAILAEPERFWAVLVSLRKEFGNAWSQTAKQVAFAMFTLARRWVRPDIATLEELRRLTRGGVRKRKL